MWYPCSIKCFTPFPDHTLLLPKDYQTEYETLKRSRGSCWAGGDNLFVRSDGSLMGQASYSTTMNIYAHSFEARKYAAQKKLNEFMQENACAEG